MSRIVMYKLYPLVLVSLVAVYMYPVSATKLSPRLHTLYPLVSVAMYPESGYKLLVRDTCIRLRVSGINAALVMYANQTQNLPMRNFNCNKINPKIFLGPLILESILAAPYNEVGGYKTSLRSLQTVEEPQKSSMRYEISFTLPAHFHNDFYYFSLAWSYT